MYNPNTDQKSPTPPFYGQPAAIYGQPAGPPLYNQPTPSPLYNQPAPPISQPQRQPSATGFPIQPRTEYPWNTGLCGCCDDVPSCCLTCWCPCITFGQIAEIVDKGSISCGTSGTLYAIITSLTCCACLYSCCYRSRMREQNMLKTSPCNDCIVHFFCECCALCQEHRELKNRGYEMSLGWEGNVHRQNPGVAMAPVMQSGMTRESG